MTTKAKNKKAKKGTSVVVTENHGWIFAEGHVTPEDFELVKEETFRAKGVKGKYTKSECVRWRGVFRLKPEVFEELHKLYEVRSQHFVDRGTDLTEYFFEVSWSTQADYKRFRREDKIKAIALETNKKLDEWLQSPDKVRHIIAAIQKCCDGINSRVDYNNQRTVENFVNQCLGAHDWEEVKALKEKADKLREQLRKAEDEYVAAKKKELAKYVASDECGMPEEFGTAVAEKSKDWAPHRIHFR